jgi:GMP reductase
VTTLVNDIKLDFSDVLFVPQRSTWNTPQHRSEVNLVRRFTFKHYQGPNPFECIPIIAANMDSTGTLAMADALKKQNGLTALHKFYSLDQLRAFYTENPERLQACFYSMGITESDRKKFEQLYQTHKPTLICVDVANGYTEKFVEYVTHLRHFVGASAVIMAGNVVTPEMTIEVIRAGADIVKVGIGSGSVCTTRKIAGVGYPQLSAVLECANAAHGQEGHICSDGGIVQIADFAKAFGAGADFVMAGGIFAGHDECGGTWIHEHDDVSTEPSPESPKALRFHGMSSKEAMLQHYEGKASYRAAEGKEVLIPYKGPVANTMEEILGGLRSTCTYIGCKRLKDLPKCTTFVKVHRTHNHIYGE